MRVGLGSQQLFRTFALAFSHPRADKTAVIKEELQQAQIGITEAAPQKEVIAQARIEIFDHRAGSRRMLEDFPNGLHNLVKLS
jgi:hypothetical protein